MPGRLEAIWIKPARNAPMDSRRRVRAVAGRGLEGNANQGGARQVTLLSREAWREAASAMGEAALDPRIRRANLMLSGIELPAARGRILAIGAVRLRIRGETRPCRRLEEARPGLQRALEVGTRGGIYGEVIEGGEITVGDPVEWEPCESLISRTPPPAGPRSA